MSFFKNRDTNIETIIKESLSNHEQLWTRAQKRIEELLKAKEFDQYTRFVTTLKLCIETPNNIQKYIDEYFSGPYVPVGCKAQESKVSYDFPHIAMIVGGALLIGACIIAEFHPIVGLAGFLISTLGVLLPAWFANQFDSHDDIEAKKDEERKIFTDVHEALHPPVPSSTL